MTPATTDLPIPLVRQVEDRVRKTTHNRIRDLAVEEVQGRVVVRGKASSHHTKQLALHGALELLSSDRFSAEITEPSGRAACRMPRPVGPTRKISFA